MKISRRGVLSAGFLSWLSGKASANVVLAPPFQPGPPPFGIGYTAVVTLLGSATYNSDGTVTGTPNGTAYTYNPDTPDASTTATDMGDFVSPFAGFTQGCVHCVRTDTDLRVWFRKDKAPTTTRIEVILDLGKYRNDGGAANLGPFSLQILKAGVPQNIPVYTMSGAGNTWVPGGSTFTGVTNVTTAYFPGMGYWTRWRWNPTPRAIARPGSQLLPANLNLLPNFSQPLGTAYGATPGSASPVVNAYTSAYGPSFASTGASPTNYNPVGINECTTIATNTGGTGDRPELGLCHESACDWVCNAGAQQQIEMLVYAEVDAGIPWHLRGAPNGYAPHDFIANPSFGWRPGVIGQPSFTAPYTEVDCPSVPVWSAGHGNTVNPGGWGIADLNHTPMLSFIPYLVTGDPYYLENLQDKLAWLIGFNFFARQSGFGYNLPDANHVVNSPAFPQAVPNAGQEIRRLGWALRDIAECIICTPASVPSWLRPKSYWQSISDLNQQYVDNARAVLLSGTGLPQAYPEFANLGLLFNSMEGYGYMMSYLDVSLGLLINQAGRSNWLPFANYITKAPIELSTGSTGADPRWTHQFGFWTVPGSTDYTVSPTVFSNYGDAWNYGKNNAMADANTQYANAWSINIDSNGCGPTGPAWQASHGYHCNSWIIEIRAGVPVTPNAGDQLSFTISGSFSGSPRTLTHTITSAEVTALIGSYVNNTPNPLTEIWLATAINNDSSLAAAGIKATPNNANWDGQANTGGSWQFFTSSGRIYVSFNSDGTSSLGGPIIGPITITGSLTTSTVCSVYIQPNGDMVHNGTSTSAVLYHRALSYQCAQAGTSASSGGPTGTTLQSPTITDGTCKWCYVPEFKSAPIETPGGPTQANYPGWGGVYGPFTGTNPSYIFWSMAGLAGLNSAGIANALTGRSTIQSLLNAYNAANGGAAANKQRWGFAIDAPGALPAKVPIAEWLLSQSSISGTTVADASGHNNTATVVGGPLTFGPSGANFNGSSQYLDSPLTVTSSALTVSCWFNPSNLGTSGNFPVLVANSNPDADNKGFALLFTGGTGSSGSFAVGNGTAEGRASWSQQLVVNTWYNYVGVYDGANVTAYINGVQVATSAFSGGFIAAGTGPDINVAHKSAGLPDFFTGAIWDVRIYNQALSASEVNSLLFQTSGVPTAIAFNPPSSISVQDNAPAGTLLTTIAVTMSDGSPFHGTLTSSDTSFFAISGMNLVTQHQLTSADDGTHTTNITATQNGGSVSMRLEITKWYA